MHRKVIKQGVGGSTIFLPAKWVRDHNIKPGDDVEINAKGNDLIISTKGQSKPKEATVEITSYDETFLRYILNNHYRAGYDKITLKGKMTEKDLNKVLHLLTGFDISKVEKDKIIIESMTEPNVEKFDTILKQIFFILKDDLNYTVKCIQEGKKLDLEKIDANGDRAIRNTNLCIRHYSKKLKEVNGFYWTLTNLLTWTHLQLYYVAKNLKNVKIEKLSKSQLDYLHSIEDSVNQLYKGIFKRSLTSLREIHRNFKEYEDKELKLVKQQDAYFAIIFHFFSKINRLIFRATSSAIGVIILED